MKDTIPHKATKYGHVVVLEFVGKSVFIDLTFDLSFIKSMLLVLTQYAYNNITFWFLLAQCYPSRITLILNGRLKEIVV